MRSHEADGTFDDAPVAEDAAVAKPVGPVKPNMAAGPGIAFRMLGRDLAVVGRVDDQGRHRRMGELAVAGKFMQRPAGKVFDTVRHGGLRTRPHIEHAAEVGEDCRQRTWRRDQDQPSGSQRWDVLDRTSDGIGAMKKSLDTGNTWIDMTIATWCNQGTNSSDFTNGQAFYDLIAQVDPNNPNTVIIGGIDLFKTTDGGTTWNQISQ